VTGGDKDESRAGDKTPAVETEKRWGIDPSELPDAETGASRAGEFAGGDTGSPGSSGGGSPLLTTYRHDIHKLRGRSHAAAEDEFAGVAVNRQVPFGADADAALLSRPRGEPEQTVKNYESPRRLSLLTGSPAASDMGAPEIGSAVRGLTSIENVAAAHAAWLNSEVPSLFNESVYYPYTSLKYHVLLVAALVSNYRDGTSFDELWLVVDEPGSDVTPHRTVLATPAVSLRVTHEPGDRPAASLGAAPARSFADVWSRLSAHPLGTDGNRRGMILDAQLRRIRSWSAALQFIEDYASVVAEMGGVVR